MWNSVIAKPASTLFCSTSSDANKTIFCTIKNKTNTTNLKNNTKRETIIGHYHSVTYLAGEYLHHDWHNEEILSANKHQSL